MTVKAGADLAFVAPSGATFKITDTKLYVSVVTLSKENDTNLLEQLKLGFKRTIEWNKYRSKIIIQPQNNNLNYLIDPTFTNGNRLFVLSIQSIAGENNTTKDYRDSFSRFYVQNAKIIDGKSFFDFQIKNEEEAYEKIMNVSNNNDSTTANLLDFAYFKKNYRLIAIDLSKQTKLKDPQQISVFGKLLRNTGATMIFIIEKSEETIFNFSQNSATII